MDFSSNTVANKSWREYVMKMSVFWLHCLQGDLPYIGKTFRDMEEMVAAPTFHCLNFYLLKM